MQRPNYSLHILLFTITLATTTAAGAEWIYGKYFFPFNWFFDAETIAKEKYESLGWREFLTGLNFSLPFLLVLTVHEFGHYFVAKANRVRVTLPYYIPFWLPTLQAIGTMGAFIRIQEFINSRRKYFDIGLAGPLAGFVVAVGLLWYGFTHLPPIDYVFQIHPEYKPYGANYGQYILEKLPEWKAKGVSPIALGDNLLFWFFKNYVADPALMPHPFELPHYPFILAGYLSLFFTAINLLPIGQLDGGHILYGLIGRKRFNVVAPVLFTAFVFYAGLGFFRISDFATASDTKFASKLWSLVLYIGALFLAFSRINDQAVTALLMASAVVFCQLVISYFFPQLQGYIGFMFFAVLIGRFLGVYHPETEQEEPLDTKRQLLGWLALLIFILCFSPKPFLFN